MPEETRTAGPEIDEVWAHPEKFNILIPSPSLAKDLPPGVRFKIALVKISTAKEDGDLYKTGTRKVGGEWVDLMALSKQALNRLRFAFGVDALTEKVPTREGSREEKAKIRYRRADGSYVTVEGGHELEIGNEVATFRDGLEKRNREDGKLVRTHWEWNSQANRNEKKSRTYIGPEADDLITEETNAHERYIKKHAKRLCETKALLAAFRAFCGMKSTYTLAELENRFVVWWYEFAPVAGEPHTADAVAGSMWSGSNAEGLGVGGETTPSAPASLPADPAPGPQQSQTTDPSPDPPPQTLTTGKPGKPPVEVRLGMLEKGELNAPESQELLGDFCHEKSITVPASLAVMSPAEVKGFIQAIKATA